MYRVCFDMPKIFMIQFKMGVSSLSMVEYAKKSSGQIDPPPHVALVT